MPFYESEFFNSTAELEAAKGSRALQPFWELLTTGREDLFRSTLFVPLFPLVYYHVVTLCYSLFDVYGDRWAWLESIKIQKSRKVTWPMVFNTLRNSSFNELFFVFPVIYAQWIWVPPTPLPLVAPTVWDFLWQQIVFAFLFDFSYWLWHIIHHKVKS